MAKNIGEQRTIWIPRRLLETTTQILCQSGKDGDPHEGVAYWAGRTQQNDVFVMMVIAPAARTTWGSFDTSASTNAKVIMKLAEARMELIGQVHSHPGWLVGHSKGDDQRALMPYDGFLSVIVPYYGQRGMLPLSSCGIHIFENLHFRRMKRKEIEDTFCIVEDIADLRQ